MICPERSRSSTVGVIYLVCPMICDDISHRRPPCKFSEAPRVRSSVISTYICVRMFVKCSYSCHLFSSYEHYSAKQEVLGHMKPGRTHWSRSRRDPCTLERVTGTQKFFPAEVDKTISLVSAREALFCTYVPLKCRHLFGSFGYS